MNQPIIVTLPSSQLRGLARQALAGKWKLAVLGTLLYLALAAVPTILISAPDIISGSIDAYNQDPVATPTPPSVYAVNLYSLLVSGPLSLGFASFILAIFRRQPTRPVEVFYGFERFGKAFLLMLVQSIFIFLWSLLFIIPGIIAAIRYSMAFYVLADNPGIGVMAAINESKRLMRGNKMKFFILGLSFIGWLLLGVLTMGIAYIWIVPYMESSFVAFYEIANGHLQRSQRPEMGEPMNLTPVDETGSANPADPTDQADLVDSTDPASPDKTRPL